MEEQHHHGYFVALFDILGFEQRFKNFGLNGLLQRYETLISTIEARNKHMDRLFGEMGFREAPHWTSDGGVFLFTKVQGAYASDSILLWAARTWLPSRFRTKDDLEVFAKDPAKGWEAFPIPCDNFLDVCNELICVGLETGLPVRGAVAMGQVICDESRPLFLGLPLIEAARLEKQQVIIGASVCKSFSPPIVPRRFLVQFRDHLKPGAEELWAGSVLDWPRHWRKTRDEDLAEVVKAMDTSAAHQAYYQNTLRLIESSAGFAEKFEAYEETAVRAVYPEFSADNQELALPARAVRRIPIEDSHGA